ncbi:hypothetical protein SCP_0110460 [Sparassis crispa]|uniref:Uncharacterized protein n=1 Tax=Sparassis crispa TaxID=139825 RepID=A0A401G7N7_9APHY|nr:hypothetical protein SCP_0110460 [Sparassis crispa]GBE78163.1 hypothetical protein SCP_0110460 [Sparassis crispa]
MDQARADSIFSAVPEKAPLDDSFYNLNPQERLLKLGKERKGAIFLDIGCCFANDIRKAVINDYPVENAIASDLEADFWRLGHQLFKSTAETFSVRFVPGDALDANFLKQVPPFYTPETPRPDLHSPR